MKYNKFLERFLSQRKRMAKSVMNQYNIKDLINKKGESGRK